MTDGSFPVELAGGVPVVATPAEIDVTNAEALRSALLAAAAAGRGTFVVDMTRTRFCDSSGLHALLAAHRRAQAEGGEVLLAVPGTAVLRVLAVTGADRLIPNFASLAEALAAACAADGGGSPHDTAPQASRGPAAAGELPGTLQRSSQEARETFTRALAGAVQAYGAGDQAVRAAYAEFKQTFEKRGDHWIPKQAPAPGASARGDLMAQPGDRARPGGTGTAQAGLDGEPC